MTHPDSTRPPTAWDWAKLIIGGMVVVIAICFLFYLMAA